jgi:hypothetical protein
MALQLGALRDALIDAGASPAKAERAAEEIAGYEREVANVRSDIILMKWMLGVVVAFQVAIFTKLFMH